MKNVVSNSQSRNHHILRLTDGEKQSSKRVNILQYYALIDWVGELDGKIFGWRSQRADRAQRGPCAMYVRMH